jgi:hypothetical protein
MFVPKQYGRILMIIDIWSNYCHTVPNHFYSSDQFSLYLLLHTTPLVKIPRLAALRCTALNATRLSFTALD